MTKDELLKAIEKNTQGPIWWEGIITAVDKYSSTLLQQTQCPHEEVMRQGDGFVYGICSKCGIELY